MSTILSLDSISHQLGNRELFQDLKLGILDKARVGIIGPNGSGKSTLMKIMAGEITPDDGRVVRNSSVEIAYIPQVDDFKLDETIEKVIFEKLRKDFSEIEASTRAKKFLTQVGFENYEQKVSELSGGWRKRLSIAIALAKEPQLLLLDEPTNHLDLSGLLWLEQLLKKATFSWILISHDRYFLEKTVKEVCEISPFYENGVFRNAGSYNNFVEKRVEFWKQQSAELSSLKNKHRNEKEWVSKSPRARGTKANYRVKEFEKIEAELRARYSRIPKKTAKTTFTSSARDTKNLVEMIDVKFGYDNLPILKKQNLILKNGIRLGILGTNGQGKSTLLKLIGGLLKHESGKIKRAHNLQITYFDQLRDLISKAKNLKDILADGSDQVIYQGRTIHIISWAKRFGFERQDLEKTVKELSGGEQARAILSVLVRKEADLLILDEPTNDLDIPMLEALEESLLEFKGALVLVTHDRFMLDRVCNQFLGFTEDQELLSFASYGQWESLRDKRAVKEEKTARNPNKKMTESERKEYGKMERKIAKAEKKLEALQLKAGTEEVYTDSEALTQIVEEIGEANSEVEELYARWEELEKIRGKS